MVRIAIIGGGIGGLTTAIALRKFGFDPHVYEQAPQLLDVGAAIALWPNAMRVLTQLGLSEQILDHAGVMKEIRWLDSTGHLLNRVKLDDGPIPAVALHRADLQEVLLKSLPSESVHLGCSLVDVSQSNDVITSSFTNGLTIESDFLVGADGIHSDVRSKLFSGDQEPTYRGYMVWRGISTVSPNTISPNTAIELHGKGKRFGIGPVGQGRLGWWATANAPNTSPKAEERSADRKTWQRGESVSTTRSKDTQRDLLRLFDGWYRPVIHLIESTPSISVLKTGAFDREETSVWGKGRITLLGDAVHPTTPNLGQGGCMAIEDAWVLTQGFKDHGPSESALRKYEALRVKRTSRVARYSRAYGAFGQWENVFARGLRRTFVSLCPESIAKRAMQVVFDYKI